MCHPVAGEGKNTVNVWDCSTQIQIPVENLINNVILSAGEVLEGDLGGENTALMYGKNKYPNGAAHREQSHPL